MEHVKCLHLFARTHKHNGFVYYCANRKSCTTTRVAVEFSKYYAFVVQAVVELFRCINSVLTRHGVNNEERVVGLSCFLNSCNLVHQLFVNSKTTCGIDNHRVVSLSFCLLYTLTSNLDRILLVQVHVDRHFNLFGQHTQLLNGSRTVYVTSYEQGLAVLFRLEKESQLT